MESIISAIVSIVVAVISGGLALIGVIITNKTSEKNIQNQLSTAQAVTDTKIEELTREVREHNNFAKRMPVLEEKIKNLEKKVG